LNGAKSSSHLIYFSHNSLVVALIALKDLVAVDVVEGSPRHNLPLPTVVLFCKMGVTTGPSALLLFLLLNLV